MAKGSMHTPTNNIFKTIVRTVVREELAPVETRLNEKIDRKFEQFEERLDSRFLAFEERMDEKLDNSFRKYRDDVMKGIDKVMGELQTIRQEQTMHQGQHQDFHEVETRVEKLEEIHPQGQHIPA